MDRPSLCWQCLREGDDEEEGESGDEGEGAASALVVVKSSVKMEI